MVMFWYELIRTDLVWLFPPFAPESHVNTHISSELPEPKIQQDTSPGKPGQIGAHLVSAIVLKMTWIGLFRSFPARLTPANWKSKSI